MDKRSSRCSVASRWVALRRFSPAVDDVRVHKPGSFKSLLLGVKLTIYRLYNICRIACSSFYFMIFWFIFTYKVYLWRKRKEIVIEGILQRRYSVNLDKMKRIEQLDAGLSQECATHSNSENVGHEVNWGNFCRVIPDPWLTLHSNHLAGWHPLLQTVQAHFSGADIWVASLRDMITWNHHDLACYHDTKS